MDIFPLLQSEIHTHTKTLLLFTQLRNKMPRLLTVNLLARIQVGRPNLSRGFIITLQATVRQATSRGSKSLFRIFRNSLFTGISLAFIAQMVKKLIKVQECLRKIIKVQECLRKIISATLPFAIFIIAFIVLYKVYRRIAGTRRKKEPLMKKTCTQCTS